MSGAKRSGHCGLDARRLRQRRRLEKGKGDRPN